MLFVIISRDTDRTVKITGWSFSTLRFDMHQTTCEALFAAGLTDGAVASFLEGVYGIEANSIEETEWASGKYPLV